MHQAAILVPKAEIRFKQLSPAEFFYSNRDMAGFGKPSHALYTTVRELFENSLDACDAAGINPEIDVMIKEADSAAAGEGAADENAGGDKNGGRSQTAKNYIITVTDNGPGMESGRIPEAFGTILYGSKFGLRQARGMFGMGSTMAVLYGQISTSVPAVISSCTSAGRSKSEWHTYHISLDIKKNRPKIISYTVDSMPGRGTGLSISITMVGDYAKIGSRIRKYIRQSALITPYASIKYQGTAADDIIEIKRITDVIPSPPAYTVPHPHGSDTERIRTMIYDTFEVPDVITVQMLKDAHIRLDMSDTKKLPKKFRSPSGRLVGLLAHGMGLPADDLIGCRPVHIDLPAATLDWQYKDGRMVNGSKLPRDLCRAVGNDGENLGRFLQRFQGIGAGTARTFLKAADMDAKSKVLLLDDAQIVELANALNTYDGFRPPDAGCLAPLGADLLEAGMRTMFEPDFALTLQRPAKSYAGSPFIVEIGIAYGGKAEPAIYRFANRIPLLYSGGSDAAVKVIESIDWKRYGIRDDAPLAICSHICSTKIPYDSVAKEQVASTDEIDKEIRLAILELARQLASYIRRRQKGEREAQRSSIIERYLAATAQFGCDLAGVKYTGALIQGVRGGGSMVEGAD